MVYRIYTHSNQTNEGHISIHAHYKIPFSQANSPYTLQYPHLDGKHYRMVCTSNHMCAQNICQWNGFLDYAIYVEYSSRIYTYTQAQKIYSLCSHFCIITAKAKLYIYTKNEGQLEFKWVELNKERKHNHKTSLAIHNLAWTWNFDNIVRNKFTSLIRNIFLMNRPTNTKTKIHACVLQCFRMCGIFLL